MDDNHWVICPEYHFDSAGNNFCFNQCLVFTKEEAICQKTQTDSNSNKILHWFLETGRL